MAGAITGAAGQPALQPSAEQVALQSNYITDFNFLNQYLPDTYEKEFERYGNRTVASFLRLVGAEMPSNSDLIKWAEQGRLHTKYVGVTGTAAAAGAASSVFTVPAGELGGGLLAVRAGQTAMIIDNAGGNSVKVVVTSVDTAAGTFVGAFYSATAVISATATYTMFIYGSEFKKGSPGMVGSLEADDVFFENKPIILKDKYAVSGSDMAQIGWVEVTTENGAGGYLWYLKSEHETRLRFEDYLEMAMVEGELAAAGSGAIGASYKGTEGLFAAVEARGNVFQNFNSGEDALDNSDGGARTALGDFDEILKNLDKQGAIEENMLFLNRDTALTFDDMLGAVNAHYNGGTSFGVFNNSEDMALNLGFSGFRRGSYDFYKTDWKYLNDATTRGLGGNVDGLLVPAGTSTVYDQQLGKNIKRPFLHVRYRASEADDRKMKSWITGSVGGVYTSDVDEMNVHFLSERCLCVQGANNFVLFKTAAQVA